MTTTTNNGKTTKDNKAIDVEVMGPESGIDLDRAIAEIDNAFLLVYISEAFLGGVGCGISKRPDPSCATAYVGVDPQTCEIYMGFNPYWMGSLPIQHKKGVIRHEYYHVCLQHLTHKMPADPQYRYLMNIATDLSINCFIGDTNLPDFALLPGRFPPNCKDVELGDLIKNFPPEREAEFYYRELRKLADKRKKNNPQYKLVIGDGAQTLDSHDSWGELPDEIKDLVDEQIRGMIRNGMKKAQEKGTWETCLRPFWKCFARSWNMRLTGDPSFGCSLDKLVPWNATVQSSV